MPAILNVARPFDHKCEHCGTKPLKERHKRIEDKKTGLPMYKGWYYSCDCYGLTLSPSTGALNQKEPIKSL